MTATSQPERSTTSTLVQLQVPVYIPMALGAVGPTMLIPVLPLYLEDVGLSVGAVSIVLAGVGIGSSLGSLPAGSAMARFGERVTLLISLIAVCLATAPLGFTDAVALLLGLRIIAGAAGGAIRLSRQTFLTRRVVAHQRGRAMSLIGGSYRASALVGPFAGGWLADAVGYRWTFVVAAGTALLGLAPAWVSDRTQLAVLPEVEASARTQLGLAEGLRLHWRRLAIAGVVPLLVMTAREGRFLVLPLIASRLDLSSTEIGALVSVSTAADLVLFPLAGWIMDRFGRLASMVPAFTLVAAGLVYLGITDSTTGVVIAGAVMGIGNGLASGTMLTLGSDLAPANAPGPFLAGMGLMQGGGRVVGPLLVGVVADVFDLGAAAIALAVVLMIAVAWMVLVLGETSKVETRRHAALR